MQKGKEAEEKKEQEEAREWGMEVDKFRDWIEDDEMYLDDKFLVNRKQRNKQE